MRLVYERRASTILHHLLLSCGVARPWLLPANVCPIVPLTFLKAGCSFELLDIDETTFCIDREQVLQRLRGAPDAYGGLLYVRTYGIEEECGPFFAAAKALAPRLTVVDDRCLCPPRFDAPSGCPADVLLYSTGYAKPIDVGSGGFAHIGDLAYELRRLPFRESELERLTGEYKAAIAGERPLDHADGAWLDTREPATTLDEYRARVEGRSGEAAEHRRRLNEIYRHAIPPAARLDDRFQGWRFNVLVNDKQRLLAAIFGRGMFASSHYADLTPVFFRGTAPRARRLHDRVVNLFNDRYFSEEQAGQVAALVREHVESTGS